MRVEQIPLELIDPDPEQPRRTMDKAEIEDLAGSMVSFGQLQPAIVARMDKRYRLVEGHRRLAAAQLLGRKELAAIVLDKVPSDDQRLMLQLTVNCLRSDLRPVEKAHAFERLKSLNNWTNVDLAKHLHLSKSHVTLCLSHLSHPPEIQAKIDAGEISSSTAYAVSRASDEASRNAMLDEALQGGLSRGDAINRVKRRGKSETKATRMVCQLPLGTVTVAATDASSLDAIGILLQKLGHQCRSAARQGYDIGTLERILADKCRKASTANGLSSST